MSKQVTEKNTKAQIFKAYQEILEKLDQQQSEIFDPIQEKTKMQNNETVSTVESLQVSNLEKMLESIRNNVEKASNELDNYTQIKMAIKIKEEELKNMFDIEAKANSLAALIKTQTELKAEFEEKMNSKKEELRMLEAETKERLQNEKKQNEELIAETKRENLITRQREQQEWNYNFDRKKKMDKDNLADELAEMRKNAEKEIEEWEDKLNEREALIEIKEENIERLEEENKELKARIEEVIQETTDKVTEKLKTSNGFEVRYLKRDHDAKVELLENKIESLQESLAKEQKSNETLSTKLDDAYARLESIANKTVESTSNGKLMSQFENMFKGQNNQGK